MSVGYSFCMPRALTKTPSAAASAAPVHYKLEVADVNAHRFNVTLTIARPQAQQRVSLPVWIPGSYLVREFSMTQIARHFDHFIVAQVFQMLGLAT